MAGGEHPCHRGAWSILSASARNEQHTNPRVQTRMVLPYSCRLLVNAIKIKGCRVAIRELRACNFDKWPKDDTLNFPYSDEKELNSTFKKSFNCTKLWRKKTKKGYEVRIGLIPTMKNPVLFTVHGFGTRGIRMTISAEGR